MEEYGIMEYLELTVTRYGRWTGNREFIWSGLKVRSYFARVSDFQLQSNFLMAVSSAQKCKPLESQHNHRYYILYYLWHNNAIIETTTPP